MKKFYFILLFLIFQPALSGSLLAQEPTIDRQYTLVNTERVNRVEFDFTYQVTVNNGDTAIQNVSATVSSTSANTVIIDNHVSFNILALAANETSTSLDTFTLRQRKNSTFQGSTLRQDKRYPFDPSVLSWVITFDSNQASRVVTPLNDTGITWGANYPEGNNAGCTGETIGEQDCCHGRDALATAGQLAKVGGGDAGFDFTKLDARGNALTDQTQDYITQPWNCVKDNHTGLIWEVKTADVQGTNLHSRNDLFTWYNTDPATNGGADGEDSSGYWSNDRCTGHDSGVDSTFCNTQAFVARVNASNGGQGLCGATDWRLPSLNELQSIVHFGKVNSDIDDNYFPNSGLVYWSSTPFSRSLGGGGYNGGGYIFSSAWILGRSYRGSTKRASHWARLVRVGQ